MYFHYNEFPFVRIREEIHHGNLVIYILVPSVVKVLIL